LVSPQTSLYSLMRFAKVNTGDRPLNTDAPTRPNVAHHHHEQVEVHLVLMS
jgi:hypothetical protein